ncbi:MAG: hypothetical protein H6724_02310 [Sandaracinus sp.]|nr:hypothetical protein [Sandaracinus sp.]
MSDTEPEDPNVGWRPRWWPLLAVVVAGTLLPTIASEAVRTLAPLLLLYVSRGWLGRISRTLMAVGSAAHGSLLLMLLWPEPFVGRASPEEALLPAIFLARILELPWMLAYARAGVVIPPELLDDDED